MLPLRVDTQIPHDARALTPVSYQTLGLINYLRVISLECRSAARQELTEACALLALSRGVARAAYAETLIRCFAQCTGGSPVFFRPGSVELSFDEAWLARLIDSVRSGDHDSFQFLIRSRTARWAQRNLAFLVRSIAEQGSQD